MCLNVSQCVSISICLKLSQVVSSFHKVSQSVSSQSVSGGGTLLKGNNQLNDGSGNDPINPRAWLGIPIFRSDFWDPHRKQSSNLVFDSKDSGLNFFGNSDVRRVRKLEFLFEVFGISVICLRRNSLHLTIANLY
jgi:hypothetical protein